MDEQKNSNNEDYLNKFPDLNEEHLTIHELEQRVKAQQNQLETSDEIPETHMETPDSEVSPPTSQVGQSFAPEVAPPLPPEPQPESEESEEQELPEYLKGADSPPPTGQAIHPAGTYQAKPGEIAQSSIDGSVGVVQNAQIQSVDLTKKSPLKIILIVILGLVFAGLVYFLLSTFVFNGTSNNADTESVDSQLTTDVDVLLQSMQSYASEHDGNYPDMQLDQIRDFATNYLPTDFIDPRTDEVYQLVTDLPDKNSEIQYLRYAQCGDNGSIEAIEEDKNKVAFRVHLSDSSLFCVDNSN